MKVLLVGATGNVGSRVLAALLTHNHTPILYLRSPDKLPPALLKQIPSEHIIVGSATDSASITKAILDNDCEALVSAAGLAGIISKTEAFPNIFKSVVDAAVAAGKSRGKPLRAWFMSGFSTLDLPENITGRKGQMILGYAPLFPDHATNYQLVHTLPAHDLDWSLMCASQMSPAKIVGELSDDGLTAAREAKEDTSKVIATPDIAPEWSTTLVWVPLIGVYLNAFANAGRYATTLEQTAEVIVRDLGTTGSQLSRKRVGILAKA